jgi:hypothetical protein
MAQSWNGRKDTDRVDALEDIIKRRHYGEHLHTLCREHGITSQTFYAWRKRFAKDVKRIEAALPDLSDDGELVERFPAVIYDFDLHNQRLHIPSHARFFRDNGRCCNEMLCNLREPGRIPSGAHSFSAYQVMVGLYLSPRIENCDDLDLPSPIPDADDFKEISATHRELLQRHSANTVVKLIRSDRHLTAQALLTMNNGEPTKMKEALEQAGQEFDLKDMATIDPSIQITGVDVLDSITCVESFEEPIVYRENQSLEAVLTCHAPTSPKETRIVLGKKEIRLYAYRFVALRGIAELRHQRIRLEFNLHR